MATLSKLMKDVTHQMSEQSASWGSLIVLICALSILMLMMMRFAYG